MKITVKITNDHDTITFLPLVWAANLVRAKNKKPCFFSKTYKLEVTSMSEYWLELGKKEALVDILRAKNAGVIGYTMEQFILKIGVDELGQAPFIAIYDIDPNYAGRLAERLPKEYRNKVYDYDVVYIPCPSVRSAYRIGASIPLELADRMIVDRGVRAAP